MAEAAVETASRVRADRRVRTMRVRRPPLTRLVMVLAGATLAELLLMRLFYRIGIFLPKQGAFAIVYRVGTAVGSFAFNLATVLAFLMLAFIVSRSWSHNRRPLAIATAGFLAATVAGLLTRAEAAMPIARLLFLMLAVGVCAAAARPRGDVAYRLAMVGAGVAVLCSTFAGVATDAVLLGNRGPLPGVAAAQILAESMTVAVSVLFFVAWWRDAGPRRRPLFVGAMSAVIFVIAFSVNGSVTGILALWTSGLRLSAPLGLYALALGCLTCAGVGWIRRRPWRSLGLFFMLAGGLLPASSYSLTLVLLGLLFAGDGVVIGGLPDWRAADGTAGSS